jgi:hypothetical protein
LGCPWALRPWVLLNALMPASALSVIVSAGAFRKQLATTFEHWRVLKSSATAAGGVDRLVDSSKLPELIRSLELSASEATLFAVFTWRDPRGFCASVRRRDGQPLGRALLSWIVFNSVAVLSLLRLSSTPVLAVSYEGLCRDPDGTLRRLTEAMGWDPRPGEARLHMAGGSDSAMGPHGEIRQDERWRSELRPIEAAVICWLTWPLRRLGSFVLRRHALRVV